MSVDAMSSARVLGGTESLTHPAHVYVPYTSQEEMLAAAEPFFRAGLERGERCIYVAADVPAASRLHALGAVSVVGCEDSYIQNGAFDPSQMLDWIASRADEAERAGNTAFRLVGELACLSELGQESIPEYEARLNDLLRGRSISVMCGYNHMQLPTFRAREALATHPLALVRGVVCHNPHFVRPRDYLSPERSELEVEWFLENLRIVQLAENLRAGSDARSKDLMRQFLNAQEAERKALARDLHDDLAQILASIQMTLRAVGDPSRLEIVEASALVGEAIESVRSLALDRQSSILEDLGLAAALRSHLDRHARRAGLDIRVNLGPLVDVPSEVATACLRIVQEAVANATHHGRARGIDVSVESSGDQLEIVVRDDGQGFDLAAPRAASSLGLVGMAERAALADGEFVVESSPGAGTTVRVRLSARAS